MTPVIETASLSVRIGAKALVDDVTLSIRSGETVAVVGPNGAGKSTLLRVLSGEISVSSGSIRLKGHDPRAYRPHELARHRAVLPQSISVAFPFTVAEVVRMGAGQRRDSATETLIDNVLAEVDLDRFRNRIIGTLSGGEQQRAHFARVLIQLTHAEATHGPGILLLDEPTSSLDLRRQLDILAVTKKRTAKGSTVVAILHDLNLAALFADRVVVLDGGRVVNDGSPRDTITDQTLDRVFGVAGAVGRIPSAGIPFVLPHAPAMACGIVPSFRLG